MKNISMFSAPSHCYKVYVSERKELYEAELRALRKLLWLHFPKTKTPRMSEEANKVFHKLKFSKFLFAVTLKTS